MTTTPTCPSCGKPIAPTAPKGLCQECLLQAGFPTGTDAGGKTARFVPPPVEEVAAKFSQLEILGFVGQGGMGAVYKARQKQLDRIVALKILPPQAATGSGFTERFTREARALARLNHPHIVTLYEFGQTDGLFYFLMEFVDGVNLRQLLNAGRMAPKEALAIVPQICEALQFAHDEGIVHRDIKPENLLLDKKGRVKIADFGIAKIVSQGLDETAAQKEAPLPPGELTGAGSTLGTPQYMAPEQVADPLEVDGRADIYSLGVVFYQMLTGELPAGQFEPPSKKAAVDARLDEVVLRALEKNPELRYQQASVLKTQVETIASTAPKPVEARKPVVSKSPDAGQKAALAAPARPPATKSRKWPKKFFLVQLPVAGLLVIVFLAIRAFLLQPFMAATDTAAPEILRGSRFLVWKPTSNFEPGVLAAYQHDGWVSAGHVVRNDGDSILLDRHGEAPILVPRDAMLGHVLLVFWHAAETSPITAASAETWAPDLAPGAKPDLQQIRDDIKALMDRGQNNDALSRQIWYFNHALEYGEIDAVRLSFGTMNWAELAQKYPKARQALMEIRAQDTQKFAQGKRYSNWPWFRENLAATNSFSQLRSRFVLFQEIFDLNQILGDNDAQSAMVKKLIASDPKLAQHMGYRTTLDAFDALSKNGTNVDSHSLGDGETSFQAIRQQWESLRRAEVHSADIYAQIQKHLAEASAQAGRTSPPAPAIMEPPKTADTTFVDRTRKLIEILVTKGRKADAEKIRDEALALVDDPWLKSAVSDAESTMQPQPVPAGNP